MLTGGQIQLDDIDTLSIHVYRDTVPSFSQKIKKSSILPLFEVIFFQVYGAECIAICLSMWLGRIDELIAKTEQNWRNVCVYIYMCVCVFEHYEKNHKCFWFKLHFPHEHCSQLGYPCRTKCVFESVRGWWLYSHRLPWELPCLSFWANLVWIQHMQVPPFKCCSAAIWTIAGVDFWFGKKKIDFFQDWTAPKFWLFLFWIGSDWSISCFGAWISFTGTIVADSWSSRGSISKKNLKCTIIAITGIPLLSAALV